MSDLLIFSCNADELLIASGKRVGIEVQSYSPIWKGYVDGKLRHGIEFLEPRTEEFAMFLDGADTLLLKSEAEILARLTVPVLIAAERTCWPDAELGDRFPYADHPRFPNAGGYIGKRTELIAAMKTVLQWATGEDDQRAWTAALLAGVLPNVRIDHERRIFCSQGDWDTEKADPCSRHYNGRVPGRQEFWEALNAGI